MDFKPDPSKRAIEICFFGRIVTTNSPSPLSFNQTQVKISECHKSNSRTKLTFKEHLENNINKDNRIIVSLKKLLLPRKSYLIISKPMLGHT